MRVYLLALTAFSSVYTINLAGASPLGSTPVSCVSTTEELLQTMTQNRDGMAARFAHGSASPSFISRHTPQKLKEIARDVRDSAREELMYWNGHIYPVLQINDTPFAFNFAKNGISKLDKVVLTGDEAAQKQTAIEVLSIFRKAQPDIWDPLDKSIDVIAKFNEVTGAYRASMEKIWTDLDAQIKLVSRYQQDIAQFTDTSADLAVRIQAFSSELRNPNPPVFEFTVAFPKMLREADGTTKIIAEDEYFGTRVELRTRVDVLTKERDALIDAANDRSIQQVSAIRKLESYRAALKSAMSQNKNTELDQRYVDFLNKVNAFYTDDTVTHIKAEFAAPSWAWESLKWRQLSAETKALYVRLLPKERLDDAKAMFALMTPEELDRLGLHDAAMLVQRITVERSKFQALRDTIRQVKGGAPLAITAVAGTGAGSGAIYSVIAVYKYFMRDSIMKGECAAKETTELFLECADNYLRTKFEGRYYVANNDLSKLLNDEGQVNDPEIQAEITDLSTRHMQYVYGKSMQTQISGPTKTDLALKDPSSDEFRTALTHLISDKDFRDHMLSTDPSIGYLQFKYGLAFSKEKIRTLVTAILDAPNKDQQQVLIIALKKLAIAKDMAADIETLVSERNTYKEEQDKEDKALKALHINIDKYYKVANSPLVNEAITKEAPATQPTTQP